MGRGKGGVRSQTETAIKTNMSAGAAAVIFTAITLVSSDGKTLHNESGRELYEYKWKSCMSINGREVYENTRNRCMSVNGREFHE